VPAPLRSLLACILLSGVLGTVHAWSLFIEPYEEELGVGRGTVSAAYSLALVALTLAVLGSHGLFRRLAPTMIAAASSGGSVAGLLLAAGADSLPVLLFGYGLLFGAANGMGYAFSLQHASEANPGRRGLSLGLVTAAYALGAALAGLGLGPRIEAVGASGALRSMAFVLGTAGLLATCLLLGTPRATLVSPGLPDVPARLPIRWLWLAYGLAVLAGLTAIGHAAAIVEDFGGSARLASSTVAVAGLASACGGVWVAVTVDRSGMRGFLVGLPLLSLVALAVTALARTGTMSLLGLSVVALAYGAVIAVYPVAVVRAFGQDRYPSAYGRVFSAWGLAGLVGPLGAGVLYDATGGYRFPLLVAAVAAGISSAVAGRTPQGWRPRGSDKTGRPG